MPDILPQYRILSQQQPQGGGQSFALQMPPVQQEPTVQVMPSTTPQHEMNGGNGAAFAQAVASIINAIGRGVGANKITGGYDERGNWTTPSLISPNADAWLNGGKGRDALNAMIQGRGAMVEQAKYHDLNAATALQQAKIAAAYQQLLNQKDRANISATDYNGNPSEAGLKLAGVDSNAVDLKSLLQGVDKNTIGNTKFQTAADAGALATLNAPVVNNAIRVGQGDKAFIPNPMLTGNTAEFAGVTPNTATSQEVKVGGTVDMNTGQQTPETERRVTSTINQPATSSYAVPQDLLQQMPQNIPPVQQQIQGPPAPAVQVMPTQTNNAVSPSMINQLPAWVIKAQQQQPSPVSVSGNTEQKHTLRDFILEALAGNGGR